LTRGWRSIKSSPVPARLAAAVNEDNSNSLFGMHAGGTLLEDQ
jgi:hypothetical protein